MKRAAVLAFAIVTIAVDPTPDTVPPGLFALTNRAPLEFATLLATGHVPSGIELKEADDVYTAGQPEFDPTFNLDETGRAPVDDLVNAFNAKHCCYRAKWMDGVFVIRPVDRRTAFLDEPSSIKQSIRVTGAMDATRRVMCQLDSSLCTGAVAGSQFGSMQSAGFFDSVVIDGTRTTVMETLNQIVRQSPRTWNVVTRSAGGGPRIIRFGLIHAHGQRTIHSLQ